MCFENRLVSDILEFRVRPVLGVPVLCVTEVARMRKIWVLVLLLLLAAQVLTAEVGEITYLVGRVEMTRDGAIYDEYDMDIGMAVDNYDQFQTSSDGELVISLDTPESPQSEIAIAPNTTFTIEIENIDGTQKTTLGLFTGSIGLKVKKLSGKQELEVNSETVSMGVRGTDFTVHSSPAGDVLVSCESGRVACYDEEEDREYYAEPGKVVEKRAQELFRQIPVSVSNLRSFREQWIAERISAFKANALKAIAFYAKWYVAYYDSFVEEYNALMEQKDILNRWAREDAEGEIGSRIQNMKDLKEINPHILKLRGILVVFERVYFRLLELETYYLEGYGRGTIQSGLTATAFFRRFEAEREGLKTAMAKYRYVLKLRNKRSDSIFSFDF